MADVQDVAAAILQREGSMSTWKLQKLVYYCQAWHLAWDDHELFPDETQAWANGPVVRSLYDSHRGKFSIGATGDGDHGLAKNEIESIEAVLRVYGKMTGAELAARTHREPPWRDARARAGLEDGERGNEIISKAAMAEYYQSLL